MKRHWILLLTGLMLLSVLCGCNAVLPSVPPEPEPEPQVSPEPIPEPEPEPAPEPEPTPEPEPEPAPAPKPTPEPKEPVEAVTESVTVTEKGFLVEKRDGLTYVGGLLIANKTYALPASYNPGAMTQETAAAYQAMYNDALAQGLDLYQDNSFRSYAAQSWLYADYVNRHGQAQADRFSARPGHSEHQTGMAIDVCYCSQSFASTPEGIWLAQHCTDYGFILRYPEGKEDITGYMYEPWHIRYVGSPQLAREITAAGTLEEYLGITSVYAE